MSTKIRLARLGSKKKPFYRIVVADSKAPRDGDFIEVVGTYNPLLARDNGDRVVMKKERVEHWLKVGAYPTEVVARFIQMQGIDNPLAVKLAKRKKSTERKPKAPRKQKEAS